MRNFQHEVNAARSVKYPALRRNGVVGIVQNSAARRVYGCCICGATESCSNDYPVTKRCREFKREHQSACGAKLLASIGVRVAVES